ncbi:exodeoxyribonuclease I [Intrasporangium oryzae NRRL B-24470]|uniref:Nuclease SbcCD subunit D n=1 Tax=Intrasporangium oryzae NRRL B-24470 TaxID=1386089 RepID=W9G5F1_9MICO|nr:exonuclease SbcCD subunit D [Intrasporangium oryzae]EWS99997.1 exodeoxyribonuclease I [Intrasporangium oryzae NRRL B-24470]
MRLLHTSDWHLGRTLHGVNLHEAQAAVLDRICELVESPPDGVPIDAVLVAGDVYDRGVPPVESVRLFEWTLSRLAEVTTVVVTSGNHDSAIRLGYGAGLFRDRIRMITDLSLIDLPVLVDGSDGVRAAVYGIPYLDPDHARVALARGGEPLPRSHQAVVSAACDRIREDLAGRSGVRSVVVAHAFVAGAEPSDSERSIMVGGVDRVAGTAFAGLDYAALGHLHGPQAPESADGSVVRYSGSPLRYSFSEQDQSKVVLLVDVRAEGDVAVTPVEIPQPRPMASLRGRLDDLLEHPEHTVHEDSWVRVTVTDRVRPDSLMDRITSRFPHALQVFHEPEGAIDRGRGGTTVVSERDPRELGTDFIAYVTKTEPSPGEIDVFTAGYEAALAAERRAEAGEVA